MSFIRRKTVNGRVYLSEEARVRVDGKVKSIYIRSLTQESYHEWKCAAGDSHEFEWLEQSMHKAQADEAAAEAAKFSQNLFLAETAKAAPAPAAPEATPASSSSSHESDAAPSVDAAPAGDTTGEGSGEGASGSGH